VAAPESEPEPGKFRVGCGGGAGTVLRGPAHRGAAGQRRAALPGVQAGAGQARGGARDRPPSPGAVVARPGQGARSWRVVAAAATHPCGILIKRIGADGAAGNVQQVRVEWAIRLTAVRGAWLRSGREAGLARRRVQRLVRRHRRHAGPGEELCATSVSGRGTSSHERTAPESVQALPLQNYRPCHCRPRNPTITLPWAAQLRVAGGAPGARAGRARGHLPRPQPRPGRQARADALPGRRRRRAARRRAPAGAPGASTAPLRACKSS